MIYKKFIDKKDLKKKYFKRDEIIKLFLDMLERKDVFWLSSSTENFFLFDELWLTNYDFSWEDAHISHISDTLQAVELYIYTSNSNQLLKNKGIYNWVNVFNITVTDQNYNEYEYSYTFLHMGSDTYTLIHTKIS